MPRVHEHFHTVRPEEIDLQGHANNVWYVAWMQDAAVAHTRAQGWPGERYRQLGSGWVVRTHTVQYLRPAFLHDELVVRTWVATMKRVTSLRRYHIIRRGDDMVLAKAETTWAFVNLATGLPTRIPREVAEAFEVVGD